MRLPVLILLLSTPVMGQAPPQTSIAAKQEPLAIQAAIRSAALDYADGWYEGDADRMESALHPDLAKRIVRTDETGRSRIEQMSAMGLVLGTRRGFGKTTPKERRQKDVVVLDVFHGAATVKLTMDGWVDYLHLAKWNGQWKIVNVLWELKKP